MATREMGIRAGREIRTRFSLRARLSGRYSRLGGKLLKNQSAALTRILGGVSGTEPHHRRRGNQRQRDDAGVVEVRAVACVCANPGNSI